MSKGETRKERGGAMGEWGGLGKEDRVREEGMSKGEIREGEGEDIEWGGLVQRLERSAYFFLDPVHIMCISQ